MHSMRRPSSSIGLAVHAVIYLHEPFRADSTPLQLGTHLGYRAEIIHTPARPDHLILHCPLNNIQRYELLKEIFPRFRDPPTFRKLINSSNEKLLRSLPKSIISCNLYF